jgi:hypothetical protein
MHGKVAVAVALALAGFTCSACGSSSHRSGSSGGTAAEKSAHSALRAVAIQVPLEVALHMRALPLSEIGAGGKTLGTFAVHGNVRIRATCIGAGKFKVRLAQNHGAAGIGGVRCQGDNTLALNDGSNLGTTGKWVRITVHASKHMKWWLDVVDRQPNF